VLRILARERLLAISVVRHRTGLRASTLDSLLDRLVARDLVRRVSPRERRSEVLLELTIGGELRAYRAAAALAEIDAELRIFLAPETLAAADALFEAARALGVPGTAADV
jgi:DNA-binding MarR family transcriptional regulator